MRHLRIKKITKRPFKGTVYNLAVRDEETYTANGIAVHNCRSTTISVTTYEPPVKLDKGLAVGRDGEPLVPQKGFTGSVKGMAT